MIKLIKKKISKQDLLKITQETFGILVKAAVDIEKEVLALGGEFHAEGQDLLVQECGSDARNVWGINFYPFKAPKDRIEYIALINIKPGLDNPDMFLRDKAIRDKIKAIVNKLLLEDNEVLSSQD